MTSIFRVLLILSVLGFSGAEARAGDPNDLGPKPPGEFDFYALSLTWVPDFCATHADPAECSRPLGFALHGYWPDSMNGYPTFCSSAPLPDDVRAANVSLFASPSLIDHEWQKHGTCTGLSAPGYFDMTRRASNSVVVPPAYAHAASIGRSDADTIKSAFVAANPGLSLGALALVCEGGGISEIHVCFSKAGSYRTCEAWESGEDNCK